MTKQIRECGNCKTRIITGQRKCSNTACGASVRFANFRCETVDESAQRETQETFNAEFLARYGL